MIGRYDRRYRRSLTLHGALTGRRGALASSGRHWSVTRMSRGFVGSRGRGAGRLSDVGQGGVQLAERVAVAGPPGVLGDQPLVQLRGGHAGLQLPTSLRWPEEVAESRWKTRRRPTTNPKPSGGIDPPLPLLSYGFRELWVIESHAGRFGLGPVAEDDVAAGNELVRLGGEVAEGGGIGS
jgi:hypothetical protein